MVASIRVLIVEDHQVVADGLRLALSAEPGFGVVGSAASIAAARLAVLQLAPDVVLMDYRLPDGDGVEATVALRLLRPETEVVMLTAEGSEHVADRAAAAGCAACLHKSEPLEVVIAAVRAAAGHTARPTADGPSARQVEILQLLADGRSIAEIADLLYLSPHTVRNHIRHASARLGTHSRLEAVAVAAGLGLITLRRDR